MNKFKIFLALAVLLQVCKPASGNFSYYSFTFPLAMPTDRSNLSSVLKHKKEGRRDEHQKYNQTSFRNQFINKFGGKKIKNFAINAGGKDNRGNACNQNLGGKKK